MDMLDNPLDTGDTAGILLGLDLELYRAINPADRPGENDYDGYDTAALALDLAVAWDADLVRRARLAVSCTESVNTGVGQLPQRHAMGYCPRPVHCVRYLRGSLLPVNPSYFHECWCFGVGVCDLFGRMQDPGDCDTPLPT